MKNFPPMERRDPGPRAAPSIYAHGLPQQGCIMFHFPSSKEGKNISKSFFFPIFQKDTRNEVTVPTANDYIDMAP